MRTHTGEKAFECLLKGCGKKFSEKGNMKTHMKKHYKERNKIVEEPTTLNIEKLNVDISNNNSKLILKKNDSFFISGRKELVSKNIHNQSQNLDSYSSTASTRFISKCNSYQNLNIENNLICGNISYLYKKHDYIIDQVDLKEYNNNNYNENIFNIDINSNLFDSPNNFFNDYFQMCNSP